MLLKTLYERNIIHCDKFMLDNTHYLCRMGSDAYGVSGANSDIDVYGFVIPHKSDVFPHLDGEIPGFSKPKDRFTTWTKTHVLDGDKEYDFAIHSIVKYFNLCLDTSPNMIDSLFVPRRCVIHTTSIGNMVRGDRHIFLSKKVKPRLLGYAYSQLSKIEEKKGAANPKRAESIEKFGYDVKAGYHCVRLALQCEQILSEHDLDLERNSEVLKSIRRGEWTFAQLKDWFTNKERSLENMYDQSTLPHSPDEGRIKRLLLDCLEHHYGSLAEAVKMDVPVDVLVRELDAVLDRYRA